MNVRAVLVVLAVGGLACMLWDGTKVRRMVTDEPAEKPTVMELVRKQIEIESLIEEIRRNDAEIERLSSRIEPLDRTYSQPWL